MSASFGGFYFYDIILNMQTCSNFYLKCS
uniref:Uncharacterized protein n=1 Tax=Anguilla anguilla TaxID=7936 RepID=A0A0E9SNS6_ANGAN